MSMREIYPEDEVYRRCVECHTRIRSHYPRCEPCYKRVSDELDRFATVLVWSFMFSWMHGQPGPLPREAYQEV